MSVFPRRGRGGKITWSFDITLRDGRRIKRATKAETMAECEVLEHERRLQLMPPVSPLKPVIEIKAPVSLSFEDLVERARKVWLSLPSYKKYYLTYSNLLIKEFGGRLANSLTVDQVLDYKNKRMLSCKPSSVNHELKVLRQVFEIGISRPDTGVLFNPAASKHVINLPVGPPSRAHFSFEQQEILFSKFKKPYTIAVYFLCRTGRRPGEAGRLTFADHDFGRSRISVWQNKSGTPKHYSVLPDINELLVLMSQGKKPTDRIFPCFANDSRWNNFRNRQWKKALKEAGISYMPPYRCRATFACNMLKAGRPMKVVAEFLGHASQSTTEKHYGFLADDIQETEILKFDSFLKARASVTAHDLLRTDADKPVGGKN